MGLIRHFGGAANGPKWKAVRRAASGIASVRLGIGSGSMRGIRVFARDKAAWAGKFRHCPQSRFQTRPGKLHKAAQAQAQPARKGSALGPLAIEIPRQQAGCTLRDPVTVGRPATQTARNKTASAQAPPDRHPLPPPAKTAARDPAGPLRKRATRSKINVDQAGPLNPPDSKQHKMGAEDYSPPSTDIITLTRHVLTEGFKRREESAASGDLTILLSSLQTTCKFIESNVRKASLINLIGAAGNTNVQGEDQKKLDVLSNEIMINALRASGKTAVLVSEEDDEAIFVGEKEEGGTFESTKGKYCVVFDPLDGSSNIDAGVNIGTIFGIYLVKDGSKGTLEDVLRPGREMVAAGYCMYGSSANLVLTTGNGVNGYTLDNQIGEFILTHPNIRLPNRGKIYSINEGNSMYYHEPVLKYLDSIKFPKGEGAKPYSARYIGSMVADVHRTLLYGGIFGYPDDKKSKSGKLRMLYEAFPMALLTEQAGGLATTGTERILDIQPTSIHQRCPVFLGSKEDVQDLEVALDVRPARNTTGSSNRRPTGI
ncbi:malate synthase [Moesziomyces antarcticus T-34]|uniref:Fructose-1,6-bisphosphatase n=1 Tax=Pseudozyma antarctica (strain T-34) TaxID=1151754 RepID=M9MAN2_PSEA3|nr:malate synthase [Moesziomyces antarcticus T-34]